MSEKIEQLSFPPEHLTLDQDNALRAICERYDVTYHPSDYQHRHLDYLPEGWVSGWVGGWGIQQEHPTIYIGCSPEGHISS